MQKTLVPAASILLVACGGEPQPAVAPRAPTYSNAVGAASVGNLHYRGEGGLRADKASALVFYRMSCALGSQKGCDTARRLE